MDWPATRLRIHAGWNWRRPVIVNGPASAALYLGVGAATWSQKTKGRIMRAILDVVLLILELYKWIVIIAVIFSWLYAFNIINTSNQFVATVWRMIYQVTEPVFQWVRRFIPAIGGLDLSPLLVLIGIFFIERVIIYYIYPGVF